MLVKINICQVTSHECEQIYLTLTKRTILLKKWKKKSRIHMIISLILISVPIAMVTNTSLGPNWTNLA